MAGADEGMHVTMCLGRRLIVVKEGGAGWRAESGAAIWLPKIIRIPNSDIR